MNVCRSFIVTLSALWLWIAGAFGRSDEFVEGDVLVTFQPGVAMEDAKRALGRHALSMTRHFAALSEKHRHVVGLVREKNRSTARLIEELQADPGIAIVEPNYIRRISAVVPADTGFSKLWGLQNTGQVMEGSAGTAGVDAAFLPAWRLARPGSGEVVVGVVDTGVDITHPDLAANIWTNRAEIPGNAFDDDGNGYRDDVHGYDFAAGTAEVTDSGDHGTHVAGTIAAVGRNDTGVIGVQYHAKILPLQVSSDGETMVTSAVLAAYDYALHLRQRGVNIVALNASFGGASRSTTEQNAIEALNAAGILLCAAAGNEGTDNDAVPTYPANYPSANIISVAALTPANSLAGFSNFGASSVDLAAPGANIFSTLPLSMVKAASTVTIGASAYSAADIAYAGATVPSGISGTFHSCGVGSPGEFPAAVAGNIALIQRGGITFAEKVTNAMAAGAAATIIYDNIPAITTLSPDGDWTLGTKGNWIPALQVTAATGQAILLRAGSQATIVNWRDPSLAYKFAAGTSMAVPHVSGAIAFAALNFPAESPAQRKARILTHTTPVTALAGRTLTGGRLNLLTIVDTDRDGLPDWWEMENSLSLTPTAAADPDGDGFDNAVEFLAGTSPVQGGSVPGFTSCTRPVGSSPDGFVLTFPTLAGRSYQVEWSSSLRTGSWLPFGIPFPGTGTAAAVTDSSPEALRRFYRLRIDAE